MGKKLMNWKVKGMNRDVSVSAFNSEFAFENMNLRLSTNEHNTLMSWVNEKGTKELHVSIDTKPWLDEGEGTAGRYKDTIEGGVLGTAVLNHQLVLFTHGIAENDSVFDCIYMLWFDEDEETEEKIFRGKRLYHGILDFYPECPLETLVSYEAEHIQKVYWTDGLNQPRVINIAASKEQLKKWNHADDPNWALALDTFFDFVPAVESGSLSVVKNPSGSGIFAPGVIQYCFSYYNKYGQQSNIVDVSPLYYLTHTDRGASPEDKVGNNFTITLSDLNNNFQYVRLYSIQRTSINLEPIVKLLDDIAIGSNNTVIYVDNGTTGSIMDPTELLFIGGKEITALTMADKDGTLFLGNIEQKNTYAKGIQSYFNKNKCSPTFGEDNSKSLTFDSTFGVYAYTHLMKNKSQEQITTFKGGEWYRFGFQLQTKTGEWTEPIYLDDAQNTHYPNTSLVNNTATLISASAKIPITAACGDDISLYENIRPVIVFPNIEDRQVLCQGVLNPTVFNVMDRKDKSPYAQASWYFRPYYKTGEDEEDKGEYTPRRDLIPSSIQGGFVIKHVGENDTYQVTPSTVGQYGFLDKVYVIIVRFADTLMENAILSRGFLNTRETTWRKEGNIITTVSQETVQNPFDGAIALSLVNSGDNTSDINFTRCYALVSTTPWKQPSDVTDITGNNYSVGHSIAYADGVEVMGISSESFDFPSLTELMRTTSKGLLYYVRNPQATAAGIMGLTVSFWVNTKDSGGNYLPIYYQLNFIIQEYNQSTDGVPIVSSNKDGNYVNFKHYDSLFTMTDADKDDKLAISKKVEIQGSIKSYEDFHTEVQGVGDKSNTQFFIDQSIVTLNSPDIEFDTDVQNFPMENLGLRVIGAIPITSSASAHHIKTSSGMLEIGHGTDTPSVAFGTGESSFNIYHKFGDPYAGRRLVAEYLWNDTGVYANSKASDEDKEKGDYVKTQGLYNFLIYPWQRSGPLNNDPRSNDKASSVLQTKRESNLLYSKQTNYINATSFANISSQIVLTENDEVMNYRLPQQKSTSSEINYYANIDKVLYNQLGYPTIVNTVFNLPGKDNKVYTPVSMRYKSTSHAVVALNAASNNGDIPILPSWGDIGSFNDRTGTTFWGDTAMTFTQPNISSLTSKYAILWLGELYKKDTPINRFGGTSDTALRNNKWLIGGETVSLSNIPTTGEDEGKVELKWTVGDTYYQRYDCLKTYPFSYDDPNQLVEILSFMCETHVNIDGRYDRNRGQLDNTMMHPKNFNLLNPIYSQQDNFFTSRKMDIDDEEKLVYPNQITYTKTKNSGADVDLWTNITLASGLELDGDKGQITSLKRFNDQLIAFQDTGISQILYNENTQIATAQGTPIEIANSGKVQGKRYLSDTIGCSNKWSICTTPSGIYFIDNHDKSIYLFNGQLQNLSVSGGMNTWCKQNLISMDMWNPDHFDNFVSYYDKQNQEVLFINADTALAYSEKLGAFTSFYDYGKTPWFVNFEGEGLWATYYPTKNIPQGDVLQPATEIWQHHGGEYCSFFGKNKPYWMTLIGNPDPLLDKTFTNLEFRATVDGDAIEEEVQVTDSIGNPLYDGDNPIMRKTGRIIPYLPFDSLETWNEYQHGVAQLGWKNGHTAMIHHALNNDASLKRKFRIWRCDIPRDNYPIPDGSDEEAYNAFIKDETIKGISRFKKHPMDRMRNPWLYLKLMKKAEEEEGKTLGRAEIHDILMTYFE